MVTAEGTDDDGDAVSDSDDATVTITDVPSSISVTRMMTATRSATPTTGTVTITDVLPEVNVTKTADPIEITEPGGMVEFSVVVANPTAEDLVLTNLEDDVHGDLSEYDGCSVPQTIPAGDSYTCSFVTEVYGEAGDVEIDTITATVEDDEGNEANGSDTATVTIIENDGGSDEDGDGTPWLPGSRFRRRWHSRQ